MSKRGERRHRSNLAQKRRICDVIHSWGFKGDFGWAREDDLGNRIKRRCIVRAKTLHPYAGDGVKMREEYRPDWPKVKDARRGGLSDGY